MITTKSQVRQAMREQRKQLSDHDRDRFSATLLFNFVRYFHSMLHEGNVACALFEPMRKEPDVGLLDLWCEHQGIPVALPHVEQDPGVMTMRWAARDRSRPLISCPYVEQPTAHRPMVVFVPAWAVDRQGNRVGSGKGYYDRFFATWSRAQTQSSMLLVAVVFSFQFVEEIASESHDVPMQYVLTEREVWDVSAQSSCTETLRYEF